MKYYFIKIFLISLILLNKVFSQWSTNPNNNLIVGYGLDPQICSDNAGGCYITYDYESTSYPRKLALERIDRYGYKPWGTKKQIQGELPGQWEAKIVEDGQGGVIVSYIDRYENLPTWYERVRVQRVDSSGNLLWGTTGVRVTLEEINQGLQAVVSDGSGGCVVAWKTVNSLFYVNRISSTGERLWSDSGKYLGISSYSGTKPIVIRASDGTHYVQVYPDIFRINQNGEILNQYSTTFGLSVADPEGGIILTGSANWSINGYTLVAQRKDSLGNNLWQEPYVEIADSLFINSQLSIRYNNNYYFGWTSNKNGIETQPYIQGLRGDGTELFINGGLPLSSSSTTITSFIPIIPSNNMSNIYIWTQWINQPSSTGNFAKRIDTTGTIVWGEFAVLLNYPALRYLGVTTDCLGGAIGTGYLNEDFAIRVFKVSVNGNLGEIIPVELISFTGVLDKDKVILNWVTATETNNSGFEIQRKNSRYRNKDLEWEAISFVPGYGTTTERKSYSFVDKDVTSGSYKYRLKQIDFDGTYKYSNEIEIVINNTPTEFALYQNYPNPFNSSTTINYSIKENGFVLFKVYNILGEEIKTLVNESKPAGYYKLEFNASDLPSGVYLYKLTTGNYNFIKKMIAMK